MSGFFLFVEIELIPFLDFLGGVRCSVSIVNPVVFFAFDGGEFSDSSPSGIVPNEYSSNSSFNFF